MNGGHCVAPTVPCKSYCIFLRVRMPVLLSSIKYYTISILMRSKCCHISQKYSLINRYCHNPVQCMIAFSQNVGSSTRARQILFNVRPRMFYGKILSTFFPFGWKQKFTIHKRRKPHFAWLKCDEMAISAAATIQFFYFTAARADKHSSTFDALLRNMPWVLNFTVAP